MGYLFSVFVFYTMLDCIQLEMYLYLRVYLVKATTSPKSSVKYGKSSRRNLASTTRDSLV